MAVLRGWRSTLAIGDLAWSIGFSGASREKDRSRAMRAHPVGRNKMRVGTLTRAAIAVLALSPMSVAHAQSPADFYKGRNVELEIGYSVGGGYDVYARMIARYLGKHIPGNPTVVTKNMEGAGSLRLANWLYNAAPKDGTVFGTIGRGLAFDPLLGAKGAQFDATKFTWIGSANDEVSVCVA